MCARLVDARNIFSMLVFGGGGALVLLYGVVGRQKVLGISKVQKNFFHLLLLLFCPKHSTSKKKK